MLKTGKSVKKEDESCPICKTSLNAYILGEEDIYTFYSCNACGSVLTEPRPTLETLVQFFTEIDPVVTHQSNPSARILKIRKRISKYAPNPANMKFLDVYTRQGYGVMAARQAGFAEPTGLNFYSFFHSFADAKYNKFGTFLHSALPEYAAEGHQADFIYCANAFCEQTDLEGFTAALAQTLSSGGTLYIEEPNGNSPWLPGKFYRWKYCDPPVTFQFLSQKGIDALLARHGLRRYKKLWRWNTTMAMLVRKVDPS